MAARSKAWVCGRLRGGIAGSSPGRGMDVSGDCWILSGIGLYDGPIPRPEESYQVCVCVTECDYSATVTLCTYNE